MSHDLKAVSKLTSVLQLIDINTFFHIRINKNNQFFILSNNQEIADHFIRENNNAEILPITLAKTSVCGKISAAYWVNCEPDSFIDTIRQLGVSNGISVALPFNEHIDIFSFASSLENTQLNNFYLNHFRLIKRFIIFFRLKARKIIERANCQLYSLRNKIALYSQLMAQDKSATLEALRKIPPRKASMQATYVKKIDLTEKETTYLVMMLEGKSMHAIADELHISPRSVESCLNTIKSKTGYNSKIKLLTVFIEHQIYQPSIYYDRYY